MSHEGKACANTAAYQIPRNSAVAATVPARLGSAAARIEAFNVWMYGSMDVWMYGCMDVWSLLFKGIIIRGIIILCRDGGSRGLSQLGAVDVCICVFVYLCVLCIYTFVY